MAIIYALAIMIALSWAVVAFVTWILHGIAINLSDFIYYSVHRDDDNDDEK